MIRITAVLESVSSPAATASVRSVAVARAWVGADVCEAVVLERKLCVPVDDGHPACVAGLGDSAGAFETTSVSSNVTKVLDILEEMQKDKSIPRALKQDLAWLIGMVMNSVHAILTKHRRFH